MDHGSFDRLTLRLRQGISRRATLGGLATSGLAIALGRHAYETDAKKKRRKKKCAKTGQATSKKRKKCCKGLVKDAAKRCASQRCVCPSDHICLRDGTCQLCNLSCASGNPVICGALLQAVMNTGETLYVCPGVYRANFTAEAAVTVIGAGEGDDPASNTILEGNGAEPVLDIATGVGPVELERLRFTGGDGGIRHSGTTLRMTECTVSDNTNGRGINTRGTLELTRCTVRGHHSAFPGFGGGILSAGTTTLTDCLIEDNSTGSDGGGILLFNGTMTLAGSTEVRGNAANLGGGISINNGTLEIAETCRVTGNTATAMGNGGGISNSSGFDVITLQGADPSPIVVNNCHENCAGSVGVPKCAETPVSCPP